MTHHMANLLQLSLLAPRPSLLAPRFPNRLTDDYLSSLSPTPDKFRITPAFYEVPEYVPPKLHSEMEEEAETKVKAVEGRKRKRDKIMTFLRTSGRAVKTPVKKKLAAFSR
jgi:hypothetical protein